MSSAVTVKVSLVEFRYVPMTTPVYAVLRNFDSPPIKVFVRSVFDVSQPVRVCS